MENKSGIKAGLIVFLALMLFGKSFSQLSEGGTPPGFKFAPDSKLAPIMMPAINTDSLLRDDAINAGYEKPYRFGYNHYVNFNDNNSGAWTTMPNGDRLWQIDVKARGAYSINLAFSNFVLPVGARLYVYSKNHKQILGGFSSKNNMADKFFGTELIYQDEVVVEYYEPAKVAGQGTFVLFRITQGYKDVTNYLKAFGDAGSCINNVNCPQYAAFATQKRAVVCLVSGGSEFCSGALVNNARNDGTPYILTANHCGTADGTWVFRFNWEAPGCANPATEPSTAQSITGGTPVASSSVSDFNLVLMSARPPASYIPFYMGWSNAKVPATSVTGIHHPSGDIKKCSRADNAVTADRVDEGNGTANVWVIGQWTDGVTEPGSSGSPLLDENKRLVGQLYGGPSECGEPDSLLRDVYGRFCVSWDSLGTPQTRLKDWLDPDSTNPVTNDGYEPYPPQYSLDVALKSVISPTGSGCNYITPVISVFNAGLDSVNSFTVTYRIDAGGDSVYNWTGSLVSLQSTVISLPIVNALPGSHVFYVNISNPNNLTDQNLLNDSLTSSFTITTPVTVAAPLVEGFQGGLVPPAGWTLTTPTSGTTWQIDTVGGYGLSSMSAAVDEFDPGASTVGEKPDLITPAIDLSHADSTAILFFDVANAQFDSLNFDSLAVLASLDCGGTWTRLYSRGGIGLATAPNTTNAFVPTATQWRTDTIHIGQYEGYADVKFDFQVISGWGNITYIDNINIGQISTGIDNQNADIAFISVFPNPFADAFTVRFSLPQAIDMNADLYAIDGKLAASLLSNERLQPGIQQIQVNTQKLSNGIYILKLNNQYLKINKM